MIKPSDIETKDFKKVALGYSPEEVDEFLDEILIDYNKLYKESVELADKIGILNQDVDYYRSIEKSLQRTLSLAEKTAEEIKESAEVTKQQIEKEARFQAEAILRDANDKLFNMEQELSKLESRYELMRTRVKLLLYAEIELLDKNDILSDKEEKMKSSLEREKEI